MDSAASKLNELLRHPEDLDKIISLKQEFTRKKAAVDSQLRSGLREQLETTQNGMTGLTDSHKVVQLIKEEMAKIDRLCSESQNMIRDLNTINLVSQAHRNFGAVEKMRKNLESFNERLIAIEQMLLENDDDMDNMPNLLPVHYELTQLRNIRDDALEQIQRAEDTSLQSTLEDYFERLDGIIATFDKHIDLLSFNLINLVVNDNNGLVVRFAVVIDTEFKSDQRVSAVQEALRDYKDMATRFQGITDGAKKTRGYMERFQSGIKANAAEQFEQAREAFLADPTTLDKIMKWYFNDLNAVKVGMVPLVPKKWKVMQIYGNAYHQLMHDFLIAIINDPDTSSAMTLEIVGWPEKYYKRMTRLGFAVDDLQPHVIDNREQEMVRDFRQLIIKFLDEWMDRIFAQDTKDFTTRSAENPNLDTDEFGYFRTRNQVDVRRMLREQVDVAANSQRADVVEGVVDAMFQRLRSRTQAWQKMLDDEARSFESGTAAELDTLQPLQDWLVATANDQIASIDDGDEEDGRIAYLSDFRIKFEPLVSQQYLERAEAELDSLRDGYVDFSTWCMTRFVTLIFTIDFGSVMPDFFTSKWYQANTMKQMVVTFEEYLGDYRAVLHHSLVDIFIEIFADELLVRYLGAVRNRGAKFRKTEPFQDKIFADVSTAFEYFSSLPNADVATSIKQTWRVMEPFLQLLTVDKDAIADAFEHFKMAYWDLQISWVEAVLRSRDDFERAMLNSVKARAAQIDVVRGPETIMGRIK
ncbi:Exocyst complex component sec6 [Ceratocystis lukuohia]|uniref:Exocyst complex component sec6 n=3 Tax=Ceratocystis TaxID=5157 RepID=A0A0F8B3P6_CERFI|nr:Exocyst complex component sec6 [Ceratocystis platani]PHH51518.1 Exocyst complex component sec6 [Ceratocystis fimbriata CBS 114723]